MENVLRGNRTLFFTISLALLVIVTSLGGLFLGNLYSREIAPWVAQCFGQDIIDLLIIVPTLLISASSMRKGIRPALFVWLGTTAYLIYTFIIYCFAVHFNSFFLVYCAVLGLSVYATITTVAAMNFAELQVWFDEKRSVRLASGFLFMLAVVFALLWLREIIPAMIHHEIPQGTKEAGLLTNPVHVLDLSIVLPGFVIASILLRRRHRVGYLLAPVLLVFAALMSATIGGLMIVMVLKGITASFGLISVFALLTLAAILIFAGLVKREGETGAVENPF
jgi:hypothetical protein